MLATSRIGPLLLDRFKGQFYPLDSGTTSLVGIIAVDQATLHHIKAALPALDVGWIYLPVGGA